MNSALLVLIVTGGCTTVAPGATASTIFLHNVYTDSADRWSYPLPCAIAFVGGVLFDALITREFVRAARAGATVGNAFGRIPGPH